MEERIARGATGEVWRAFDTAGDRPVAVKLLPPELRHSEEALDQVRRSFGTIHTLHHQHICPVYSLAVDPRFGVYLAMKLVPGVTAARFRRDYLSRHDALPLPLVVELLRPIAEALDYAHGKGVLHRDVKPQNILIHADGDRVLDVQLTDFAWRPRSATA